MPWCNTSSVPQLHRNRSSPRWWLVATAAAAAAAAAAGAALALARGPAQPPLHGDAVDRAVPQLSLEDDHGSVTSLAAFRGRVVVLAPFLTLCHEVCPLTTGAFQAMQRDVARAGLTGKVVFAEVSVDPWRDTPARLRAFARLTPTRFPLLTGTPAQLARFWRFFGVAYWRTEEGVPADTDWRTGKPLTFDVSHTDGLFLIDASGHERILDVGMPQLGPRLPTALSRLLNADGRSDLMHPRAGWTIRQALDDLSRLAGRPIPT
jgi:cytochrome oxidase Cu insertion factor (SCO1/SenC/PrrC family)